MISEMDKKAGFSEEFLLEQYKTDTKLPVLFYIFLQNCRDIKLEQLEISSKHLVFYLL